MGVGYSLDLCKLDVCFGGFSPTLMGDSASTLEQVLAAEERVRSRRASLDKAVALKSAITSDVRSWDDGLGTVWSYIVLDGAEVCIEGCSTQSPTLSIPPSIEGKPVVALAVAACAGMPDVEEIYCADSIVQIDSFAFRKNPKLRKVMLPKSLAEFNSEWFRACPKIEQLALPGQLARLSARVFDLSSLKALRVGAGACEVMPGTFEKSRLESIEVDEESPFLASDGRALYSKDGTVLVALAVPGDEYKIREGCRIVGKKGFSSFACIKQIELPEGLEVLDEFAFARTGISSFVSPTSLKHIMKKAFFHCAALRDVCLFEGLLSVHEDAFTGTNVHALHLPSTVEELKTPLATGAPLVYSGDDATFSIAEGSTHLDLDEDGGLYQEGEQGKHLLRMMNPHVSSYAVKDGTVAIDEAAFANHASIKEVFLPEGLLEIGRGAFRACHELVNVAFPDSVRHIGKEAFLDTNIESLRLPGKLEFLGQNALVSYGSHHGAAKPSIHEVSIDEGNERFYTESGLLLERKDRGKARVLICTGEAEVVCIPEEVNEIAPYAFNDVGGIRELHISDRIKDVGVRGLAIDGRIERIHIALDKPIDGHEAFCLSFPDTDRGAQQMMLALSVPDHVDPAIIFEHYDNAIINASSFDAERNAGLGIYDQSTRIVERLLDPVFLTGPNRSMCDHVLKSNIEDICVQVAKHDDRRTFDKLLDLGYLNAENINAVIDRIAVVQDAAMTGYLLEAKRLRFKQGSIDFDL